MVQFGVIADAMTVGIALLTVASAAFSWMRDGTVYRFYKVFDKVDHIESKADEIKDWTEDAEIVFVELARDDSSVDPEGVKDLFDVEETRTVIIEGKEDELERDD